MFPRGAVGAGLSTSSTFLGFSEFAVIHSLAHTRLVRINKQKVMVGTQVLFCSMLRHLTAVIRNKSQKEQKEKDKMADGKSWDKDTCLAWIRGGVTSSCTSPAVGKLFHEGMVLPALQSGANRPAGLPAIGGESPAARAGRLRKHAEVLTQHYRSRLVQSSGWGHCWRLLQTCSQHCTCALVKAEQTGKREQSSEWTGEFLFKGTRCQRALVNQASSPASHSVHHRLHRVQACFHSSVLSGRGENNSSSHGLQMELCIVHVLINTVPNVLMTSIGHVLALLKPSFDGTTVWSTTVSNGAKCSFGPKSMLTKNTFCCLCVCKWPDHVSLHPLCHITGIIEAHRQVFTRKLMTDCSLKKSTNRYIGVNFWEIYCLYESKAKKIKLPQAVWKHNECLPISDKALVITIAWDNYSGGFWGQSKTDTGPVKPCVYAIGHYNRFPLQFTVLPAYSALIFMRTGVTNTWK